MIIYQYSLRMDGKRTENLMKRDTCIEYLLLVILVITASPGIQAAFHGI